MKGKKRKQAEENENEEHTATKVVCGNANLGRRHAVDVVAREEGKERVCLCQPKRLDQCWASN